LIERDDLLDGSEEPFVTAASGYLDAHPNFEDPQPRIYVKFRPAGAKNPYVALLDTGAHYCVLAREIADSIRDHLTESIGETIFRTAQGLVRGDLYAHTVTLLAERGKPLDIDSVLFISPDWQAPSFLGYVGVLDRMRFAVDPRWNRFYFGPLR